MVHQTELIDSERYSIDSSVILDIWCPPDGNIFSKERVPELWSYIEKLMEEGRIIATREVLDELEKHAAPDLQEWLNRHKDIFVIDEAQVIKAGEIINEVYSQYKRGYTPDIKDGADPFVVAAAMTNSTVVFTQETEQAPHDPKAVNTPKIPTVCQYYGVEHVNILQFIDRENLKLGLST